MIITLLIVIALAILAIKFLIGDDRHMPTLERLMVRVFVVLCAGFLGIVIYSLWFILAL